MFNVGDSVEVVNNRLQSFGLIGTITSSGYSSNSSFVKFDNWKGRGEKKLLIKN